MKNTAFLLRKGTVLFLTIFVIAAGCSKSSMSDSNKKLYMLPVDQIKSELKGSWEVKSKCYITIAGLNCTTPKNEFLTFTGNDSVLWTQGDEIYKKDKVEFIRIKTPEGEYYETDSLYVFKFSNSGDTYFPYEIVHDSLRIEDPEHNIDAGFGMILTRSK